MEEFEAGIDNYLERMAKATEGMPLNEKREYWRLLREGKVKLK